MVFYRKYRPQKIEELDSKEVREKLYTVLKSPSVAHAFLFTGPKGLGKTSAARIVAKALNCEKLRNEKGEMKNSEKNSHLSPLNSHFRKVEPCNKCEQCISITNGTNLDVLEIDGASNRGIDEIRDLREKVRLSPAYSRKKVYIIDEVHMLTTEAFNALLKTLEEPPSHVVFILCTTEPHKVPATIVSRCLQIQFRKAGEEELVRSFERILKAEKIKSDKGSLNLIASLSDGSFRDGAKILEEMSLLAGRKKITKELVEKQYQISNIKYEISKMIEILEKKDTKSGLELISKLINKGTDMKFFMAELVNELHMMLLVQLGIKKDEEREIEFAIEDIKRLIELLSKAISELKYAVLPQIPLELVVVEWGIQKIQNQVRLGQNTQKSGSSDGQTIRQSDVPSFPSVPKITQQDLDSYNSNNALRTALIDKVKTYNHSVAGVLRGCSVKSYDDRSLTIETNFKFHKDKLSEARTKEVLRNALKEITKKDVDIDVLLKEK